MKKYLFFLLIISLQAKKNISQKTEHKKQIKNKKDVSTSMETHIIMLNSKESFTALEQIQLQIPVVVKLSATWCPYCDKIKKEFVKISSHYKPGVDAVFFEIMVQEKPALGSKTLITNFIQHFNITIASIPSFVILYKNEIKVIQGSDKVSTIEKTIKILKEKHPRLPSITKPSLEKEFALSKKQPVIIKIHAFWCPPCSMMEKPFDTVAEHFKNKAIFLRLDTVENSELSQKIMFEYKIMGIPAILLLNDGKIVEIITGSVTQEELINKILNFIK